MRRTSTALIIGGGIAGTATAMALQKAGMDSVVYEAHPTGCRRHRGVSHAGIQRSRRVARPRRGQARPGRRLSYAEDHASQRHRQAPRREPHRPVAARRHDQPDHQARRPVPRAARGGERPGLAHRARQAPGRSRGGRRRGAGGVRRWQRGRRRRADRLRWRPLHRPPDHRSHRTRADLRRADHQRRLRTRRSRGHRAGELRDDLR